MSQSPIEHLLQATPLRLDRTLPGSGRIDPTDLAFGDHFARVTTPNDPPKKIAPEPVVNTLSSPDSHRRSESASPRVTSDSAYSKRSEDSAAESRADNKNISGALPDKNENAPSGQIADGEQNPSPSSNPQSAKIESEEVHDADSADSTEDSKDNAEAAEMAILVSAQAIAQTNDGQIAACGEEFVEQNASNESDIAPVKSQTTCESPQATKKSAAVVDKNLQESEHVKVDATTGILHEDSVAAEPDHSQSSRKHENRHTEQAGEATKTREQNSAGVKNESLLAADVTIATPVDSSTKSDRPTRPNRTSTKKDPSGASEKNADEVSEPDQAPVRAETVARNDGPTANQATAVVAINPANADAGDNTPQKGEKPSNSRTDALIHPLGKLQRGSGRTAGLARGEESQDKPQIDAARFVGRVSKAFQTAQQRGGTLQLRLSPPELGTLRLELSVKDGAMTAVLQTETDTARRVLLDHLPALRDRLAEQNIRIERFDVDVRREDNGGQADGRMLHNQQQRQQDQQANNPTPRRAATRSTVSVEAAKAAPGPTAFGDGNGLNIVA